VNQQKASFFRRSNKHFIALIIGVVAFAVYANTIPNFLNIDDELIYENHVLKTLDFSSLKKIFTEPYYKDVAGNKYEYRPVVLISYYFEFLIFGRNPHVSHAVNVILYSITCVLLFYLLLLFGPDASAFRVSIMAGLLFTLHMVHTEAVASIKNRDELLSLFFSLIAWMFALRFTDTKKIVFFLLLLVFFTAGLFSKQTNITFAILIPASVIVFRHTTLVHVLTLSLPLTLVAAIFSPVYLLYKKAVLFFAVIIFLVLFYYFLSEREKMTGFITGVIRKTYHFILHSTRKTKEAVTQGIAVSRSERFTSIRIHDRMLIAIGALVFFASAFFFLSSSHKNAFESVRQAQGKMKDKLHDFRQLRVTPALQTPAPTLVPIAGRKLNYVEVPLLYVHDDDVKAATSIFVLGKYLRLMLNPSSLGFYYGYGQIPIVDFRHIKVWYYLLLYLLLLSLMSYLFVIRRHLIAAYGILFYLISIFPLSNLLTPIAGVMAERLAYAPSLGYCIAFGYFLAYPFIAGKERIMKLKATTLARASLIFSALLLSGFAYGTVKRNFYWKDRLTLMRHDIHYLEYSARANHLLATHLAHEASRNRRVDLPQNKKLLEEAVFYFKRALEIYPEFPYAWYDLAKTYVFLKDKEKALEAYARSTQIDSLFAPAWFESGVVLGESGKAAEAEYAYRQAVRLDSALIEAYTNLSFLYYQQERYREALDLNLQAIRHKPSAYAPYVNLGRIYMKLQDTQNALLYLEKAVAINNSDKKVMEFIASLYQNMGNNEKAAYYRNLASR